MPSVQVQHIPSPGADLEPSERPELEADRGEVRIGVEACGVCHSHVLSSVMATTYPIVPGHGIAGAVEAVGDGVGAWHRRDRVGVGWFGGSTPASRRAGGPTRGADLRRRPARTPAPRW